MKKLIFLASILLVFFSFELYGQNPQKKAVLVVHGGAGTILKENMTKEKEDDITQALGKALMKGFKIIKKGGSSEEAVIASIIELENDPNFNSARGAVLNENGEVEMDASLMSGKDMSAGAVAGVHHIKNPILAAQAVKNHSEHVLLSGEGAEEFAKSQDIEFEESEYFKTEQQIENWNKAKMKKGSSGMDLHLEEIKKFGTVGAVALDKEGNIAAGTSTGGMLMKKHGRIGDSPLIGSGTYAKNSTCGVSCTGHGEYFIKYAVAYDVSALMEYKNLSVDEASKEIINKKLVDAGGQGGLIALDSKGNYSFSFNTPGMYRGVIFEDGSMQIEFYK